MQAVGKRLEKSPLEIRYAYQELTKLPEGFAVPDGRTKPWGTSHAVLCAAQAVDGAPFAAINADDYYGKAALKKIYTFLENTQDTGNRPLPSLPSLSANSCLSHSLNSVIAGS